MNVFTRELKHFEFGCKDDREEAFLNIVKWFGSNLVEKVERVGLVVKGSEEILRSITQIVEKHAGRCCA